MSSTEKPELLPCPFCGGPAVNVGYEFVTCGAAWFADCAGHTVKTTAPIWNTRHPSHASLVAERDGLRSDLTKAYEHFELLRRIALSSKVKQNGKLVRSLTAIQFECESARKVIGAALSATAPVGKE